MLRQKVRIESAVWLSPVSLHPPRHQRPARVQNCTTYRSFAEELPQTAPPQTGVNICRALATGSFWSLALSSEAQKNDGTHDEIFLVFSSFNFLTFSLRFPVSLHPFSSREAGSAVLQMRPKAAAVMLCQLRGWLPGQLCLAPSSQLCLPVHQVVNSALCTK